MVIVYYKGVLDQCFGSLADAERYVHGQLESDWSKKVEDFSYSL